MYTNDVYSLIFLWGAVAINSILLEILMNIDLFLEQERHAA